MPGIDSNTKLLLKMNGADASTLFVDSSFYGRSVTVFGNAQIDTAQSKFGSASGLFDGTGDYLTVEDSSEWDFRSGDFTIDFWVRFNSVASVIRLFSLGAGGADGITMVYITNLWQISCNDPVTPTINYVTTPSTATWYHYAIVRTSGTLILFIDGTNVASGANSNNFTPSEGPVIGTNNTNTDFTLNGWIDEYRISNVARWTNNFNVATEEYSAIVYTKLNKLRPRAFAPCLAR